MFEPTVRVAEFPVTISSIGDTFTGTFHASNHDILFYGPTVEHIIGVCFRYAELLAGSHPFTLALEYDGNQDDELETLPGGE